MGRLIVQAGGFAFGAGERNRLDGRPKKPLDQLAARARRALAADHQSDALRQVVKEARKAGLVERGELTAYGHEILEVFDRLRSRIISALPEDDPIAVGDLVEVLGGDFSLAVFFAAVEDLESENAVKRGVTECPSCHTRGVETVRRA
jgi:hypothetical protein